MSPGDYVLIQFAHNDEKTQGMDGDELIAYYKSIGDDAQAAATDYRGTNPSTTYKEYLRKYVTETRDAGCIPILVGPICRMYFSGNDIRRNGRHDLGDNFSKLTSSGVLTSQKVAASDNSMDYVWQMEQVANEMNVPFIDLTTATADLYLSYGDSDCHSILSDGDGSTHLSAVGAALIARRFAGLCREAGVMSEHIRLTSDLSVSPSAADLGRGYVGQTLTKELMVTAFDLTPAAGQLTVTAEGNAEVSTDLTEWSKSASVSYEGGTIIRRFSVRMTLESDNNDAKIIVSAGGNGMCVHVYYSTEDDFSDTKLIYEKKSMPANTMLDGTVRPIISLEGGKSLRLRFYPWYNSAATGKTICLSDIRFHGWATASGESGIAEIEGDRTIVETSYYTLQGCRVSNPSSGFYIARSLYSDGSVKTEKVIL